MMFRKLYWITEQVEQDGSSRATGVYTSVYDLIKRGLPRHEGELRLSLAKVDSDHDPLGVWNSPDFVGMSEALKAYVATDEITEEDRLGLMKTLANRSKVTA